MTHTRRAFGEAVVVLKPERCTGIKYIRKYTMQLDATVVDTSHDLFDAIFAANARGAFLTLRESALRLRDGGRVVAISAGPEVMEAEVAKTPLGRLGRPQDIADVVGFLVSEQAGWITGQLIGAGGGMF